MGDGPPCFRRGFSCPAVLRIHAGEDSVSRTGLLPAMADRSKSLPLRRPFVTPYGVSFNPGRQAVRFGLQFRFARRYSGNRVCFLFLRLLRCFSSPGLPSSAYSVGQMIFSHDGEGVSPFGHLRIQAYLQLPEAYRCSSRPSSAPSAKASTVRPSLFNHM